MKSIGADASGPVSFMDVWDAMCRTIMSAGARRGAMMACLRCDHPDIEDFIGAKSDPARLRNFNLSVLVTDAFMAAVKDDAPWDLVFGGVLPEASKPKVYRTVQARALWERIMRATYDYAEPGVIFIDRINARNNLAYCETIHATNPCGEQPLPPHGACLLGSINLAALVERPFTSGAAIATAKLEERVRAAVRFLDNVIDISNYPLPAQRQEAFAKRRIGLGLTGLADALIFSGERYGSDHAAKLAGEWMATIQTRLMPRAPGWPLRKARSRSTTPSASSRRPTSRRSTRLPASWWASTASATAASPQLRRLAPSRCSPATSRAASSPSSTTPIAAACLMHPGDAHEELVEDYAHALYRRQHGPDAPLTSAFVRAADLTPREHLVMQAAVQAHVDSSISKTINCPVDITFDAFKDVYSEAYALGLKGCTTYRPNAVTGAVLVSVPPEPAPVPAPAASVPAEVEKSRALAKAAPDPARHGDVVYMSKPLERDAALAGYTYKLKWPESEHALYVTINDIEGPAGGGQGKTPSGPGQPARRRPFEVFINTKNLEHYAWTVALTRMISAVFRRGGDVTFVAEELKAVFDPQGGRWMGGRYVPSLLAAIGQVIEDHMVRIGFIAPGDTTSGTDSLQSGPLKSGPQQSGDGTGHPPDVRPRRAAGRPCPRCSSPNYVREEGCWVCRTCGFSRCG